jgi:hypothetical protein
MAFGDSVTMYAITSDERRPFGTISQKVVQA